jgi:hypothetical protein
LMTLIGWVTCDSFAVRQRFAPRSPRSLALHSELVQALVWQVAEPNPTPMNSMSSMALPFAKANGSAQGKPFQ